MGDLERKELRAVSNYTLYDDPVRLLRVLRFKVRLGFNIDERTKMQYDNAREAQLETRIPQPALLEELRHTANEAQVADVVKLMEEEKLLRLYSKALEGGKMNMPVCRNCRRPDRWCLSAWTCTWMASGCSCIFWVKSCR